MKMNDHSKKEKQNLLAKIDAFSTDSSFMVINHRLINTFGLEKASVLANLIETLSYSLDFNTTETDEKDREWFFLTNKKQLEKLQISERSFRKIKKELQEQGILKTKRVGIPSKEYYPIDFDALDEVLIEIENNK